MAVSQILKLTEISVDTLANTSRVRILWKSQQTGASRNEYERTAKYWITVNGVKSAYTVPYTLPANSTETILNKTVTIPHREDGTGSIQVQTWMDTDISAGVVERKESLTLTPIARASTIGATDAFVESTSIIAVNRKSEEYTHSIAFSFGELTGYIDDGGSISPVEIRHTGMSVPFRIPPAFYDYMTDKPSETCYLVCRTYLGDTQIGSDQKASFAVQADAALCKPEISCTVTDSNPITLAMTGNADILVRHMSIARCELIAQPRKGAQICKLTINDQETEGILELDSVTSGSFSFSAEDSRGFVTTKPLTKTLIPYVPLTLNPRITRTDPTSGNAIVEVKGQCYAKSCGAKVNALTLSCSINGSAPETMAVTVSEDGLSYQAQKALTGLDYDSSHTVCITLSDAFGSLSETVSVKEGIPVFDWGRNDFAFHVPVQYGDKLLEDWFVQKAGDTMEGKLSMGGNRMTDLAEPILPADAVTKSYADGMLRMKLVWEDPIPVGFSAKTIDCDLSGAQAVVIEYVFSTTSSRRKTAFGVMGTTVTLDVISKSFYLGSRTAFPSASGVYFGEATYNGTGSDVEPDNYMLPVRIYSLSGILGLPEMSGRKAICGTFTCGMAVAGQ